MNIALGQPPGLTSLAATLSCVRIPARGERCPTGQLSTWEQAYELWHATRAQGMRSEGMVEEAARLSSDGFLEQDEVVCVLSQGRVLGLFLDRTLNLAWRPNRALRYFEAFPEEVVDTLFANPGALLTFGHLAVDFEWRKSRIGVGIAELLLSLSMLTFRQSRATLAISYARNNRKIHELCYRHGAFALYRGLRVFRGESDIVAWHRADARSSPVPGVAELAQRLWDDRIDGL